MLRSQGQHAPAGKKLVREIWSASQGSFPNDTPSKAEFHWKEHGKIRGENHRQEVLKATVQELLQAANDSGGHCERLDGILSDRLQCRFDTVKSKLVVDVCHLLERLPRYPSKIDFHMFMCGSEVDLSSHWPAEYMRSDLYDTPHVALRNSPWEELKVVSFMDCCTVRLAIATKLSGMDNIAMANRMKSWLDVIAELLDVSQQHNPGLETRNPHAFHVLGSFLWSVWQRSAMVFFTYVLENQLMGYQKTWNELLALRGPSLLSHRSIQATLNGWSKVKSEYMCSWAFELLKASRASIGLDFRTFHDRFDRAHGANRPRCTLLGYTCDGKTPESCGRFKSKLLVKGDQSLHDGTCQGDCRKIAWDKGSYQKVDGGRAVLLKRNPEKIRYCQASQNTLAISHVWSHGQGGRPSTGINRCTHERYVMLAEAFDCKSYWMDTICIPEEHDLRQEAIRNINKTFSESKKVLICDRDLMAMTSPEESDDPLRQAECLMATLLVCDWNVRAWTMLEAIRGNHSLHVLCKDNMTISVKELIKTILRNGSVDLATLSLSTQHLLAGGTDGFRKPSTRKSVEEASNLLSHRYATREGDDIVIWSLLCSTDVFSDPLGLWKSKIRSQINTGYLMSSAPRVRGLRGFSWAPSSPNVRDPNQAMPGTGNHFSYEGGGSATALVTPHGLKGDWLMYELKEEDDDLYRGFPQKMITQLASGESSTVTIPDHRKVNHCWKAAMDLKKEHRRVSLLQPQSGTNSARYEAADDKSRGVGPLFAVCFSDEDDDTNLDELWEWAGVYEWENSITLPQTVAKFIVLV